MLVKLGDYSIYENPDSNRLIVNLPNDYKITDSSWLNEAELSTILAVVEEVYKNRR